MDQFWTVAWTIGTPFVLSCIVVWAFYNNKIYTAKSYKDLEDAKNVAIHERDERIAELWSMVKASGRVAESALNVYEKDAERKVQ